MNFKSVAIVAVMGAALAGCQGGPKETFGGLTGAVAGGVIGSQIGSGEGRLVATAAGAALGALADLPLAVCLTRMIREWPLKHNIVRWNMVAQVLLYPGQTRIRAIMDRLFQPNLTLSMT